MVTHLVRGYHAAAHHNAVDGDAVPVPHCGAALTLDAFNALAARLRAKGVKFVIEPHLRFQVGGGGRAGGGRCLHGCCSGLEGRHRHSLSPSSLCI